MAHAIASTLNALARDIDLPGNVGYEFIHDYFGTNDEYSSGMYEYNYNLACNNYCTNSLKDEEDIPASSDGGCVDNGMMP